eukprot:3426615-Rhodomonas_salina.1
MGRCCGVGSVDSGFWLQAERRLQAEDLSRLDRGIELELGGEEAGLVEGLELVDADLLGALLELPLSDAHLLVLEPQHVLGARVLHLVADHHAQDVQQQLVVVLGVVQVRVERAAQRALCAEDSSALGRTEDDESEMERASGGGRSKRMGERERRKGLREKREKKKEGKRRRERGCTCTPYFWEEMNESSITRIARFTSSSLTT